MIIYSRDFLYDFCRQKFSSVGVGRGSQDTAVFASKSVSLHAVAARVRMSMSSFAIIEMCWFIAKVNGL